MAARRRPKRLAESNEGRRTYASFAIAAGVNAKSLSKYMGPRIDPDHVRPLRAPVPGEREARQGKRLPTVRGEAAGLLDRFFEGWAERKAA
jgi:hypothetical protein